MTIINSVEHISFNEDFSRIFDGQREEARNVAIADELEMLIQEDGDCYPFTRENMFEALTQVSEEKQNIITGYFVRAARDKGNDNVANYMIYMSIRLIVHQYWSASAEKIATKNVDGRLT